MNSAIQSDRNNSSTIRLAAIVLAAGYSSRMGKFKPLLRVGNATALERSIKLFHAAGVSKLIAVLGHRSEELRPLAERCSASCVINPQFACGMFSSILVGTRALPHWVEAAFVLPADVPLVRASTVRQIAEAWTAHRAGIAYPRFDGRRGHPPLIAREILDVAAEGDSEGPLSALLASHERDAIEVQVADEAIHMDMDTQLDYEVMARFATRREVPTAAECQAILADQAVEPRIVRHSRKVAEIAAKLSAALISAGLRLDSELVQAGALLHDVAKGQTKHASTGASILRRMDFDRVADVVAAHTDIGSFDRLDERAIVYLADKLVCGEEIVTLQERFAPALRQFRRDAGALKAARSRLQNAMEVAHAVETRAGADLETIVHWSLKRENRDNAELRAPEMNMR